MLRQALAAPSRAARSSIRSVAQRPYSRPQFVASSFATRSIQPSLARRWYSAEGESKEKAEAPKEGESKTEGENAQSPEAELKKKLETKEKEILEWKDKYLRSVADFRNLQDRSQREMKSARDFAIQKFAKDLVDSVDNLDRALAMVPEEKLKAQEASDHAQDLVNLYEGLKMTESILMQTLKKHGLERFDPSGEKFNPNEHEATFMAPMPDKEDNTVFHTQQKGFKLNGRILRAAKVGVAKNK
ncbi:hypothetical protein NKR23_g7624 [Pleurostoma richardsiae]|uniref:GrpE protein homolog n=1 Tax=Pleurostoma richardsiae TaxID=41990 RepID=A0AA38RHI9_9PEZI|nr:hypothetical protein NKR23_g7624 [Pleurostoma richardsiae]